MKAEITSNNLLYFEFDRDSGYCTTKCPHGIDCNVNSMVCTKCSHYFGEINDTTAIRCTGNRIQQKAV